MIREKLFAERRAGLLQWAIDNNRLNLKVVETTTRIPIDGNSFGIRELFSGVRQTQITYDADVTISPQEDGSINLEIIHCSSDLAVHDNHLLTRTNVNFNAKSGAINSYKSAEESREGGNLKLGFDHWLNEELGPIFKYLGKERGHPTTWLDWVGQERPKSKSGQEPGKR